MVKNEFTVVFNSIATAGWRQMTGWVRTYKVDSKYYSRFLMAKVICFILEPFRWVEKGLFSKKIKSHPLPASPVFILGHWRSGTTLLHNVLCQDPKFAFITTYQGVFSNVFFTGRSWLKYFMRFVMPEKRPGDNVKLAPDFPQEEEIALSNFDSFSFYTFFYFPQRWKDIFDRYMSCSTSDEASLKKYRDQYRYLMAQALINQDKKEFISKNPPNTARIQQLLKMFPDAKFIYIYRHPIEVFLSTYHFFSATFPALQLQEMKDEQLKEMVYELYRETTLAYERDKSLIPEGHLIEIRYEDFLVNPLKNLEHIYASLKIDGIEEALPWFKAYLETQRNFKKNTYPTTPDPIDVITNRLAFAIALHDYSPEWPVH